MTDKGTVESSTCLCCKQKVKGWFCPNEPPHLIDRPRFCANKLFLPRLVAKSLLAAISPAFCCNLWRKKVIPNHWSKHNHWCRNDQLSYFWYRTNTLFRCSDHRPQRPRLTLLQNWLQSEQHCCFIQWWNKNLRLFLRRGGYWASRPPARPPAVCAPLAGLHVRCRHRRHRLRASVSGGDNPKLVNSLCRISCNLSIRLIIQYLTDLTTLVIK